jgi:cell division protein FtsW (lipid II flippase)
VNKYKEEDYNKNFKWVSNWMNGHFLIKIFPFILLLIFMLLIIRFFIFKKKPLIKSNDKLSLLASFLAILIWLINFPQYRFGFTAVIIFIFLIFELFANIPEKFEKKRFMSILLIGIVFFNLSNLSRISSEMKREDVYNYSNFPWFAKPPAYFKIEASNSSKYLRSKKGKNFWRTCFNAHLICVNHDDKVDIKKNNRLVYISKN